MGAERTGVLLLGTTEEDTAFLTAALGQTPDLCVRGHLAGLAELGDPAPADRPVARAAARADTDVVVVERSLIADPVSCARSVRARYPRCGLVALRADPLEPPLRATGTARWIDGAHWRDPRAFVSALRAALACRPAPGTPLAARPFPADASAPSLARRFVADAVAGWVTDETCDTARLLVSELVTNAVTYTHKPCRVEIASEPGALTISVLDRDHGVLHRLRSEPEDPTGRGLDLVERLTLAWGCERGPAGKRVWFSLASST